MNTLPPDTDQQKEKIIIFTHFQLHVVKKCGQKCCQSKNSPIIHQEELHLLHLVMKVQSCTTLFSSWTPAPGSEVTICPLCRQCKLVVLSTKEAVQWKGSRSPLKTTWRWDGSRDRVCSSTGPSEQHGGKRFRYGPYIQLFLLLLLHIQPQYVFTEAVISSTTDWMQAATICEQLSSRDFLSDCHSQSNSLWNNVSASLMCRTEPRLTTA